MKSRSTGQPPANFARKVRLSTWALFFERLWPRFWVLLALTSVFVAFTLVGGWSLLPDIAHKLVLAVFAFAAIAALVYALRAPWPNRDEAVRRIEARSGVPHRPASSYEDTLSVADPSTETSSLWHAHRERLARAIQRLKVGNPSPRADRFDPYALRLLAVLLLIPAAALVSGSLTERLQSAFQFGGDANIVATRLDAWVAPPAYTAKPPIMLADGGAEEDSGTDKTAAQKFIEIPEGAVLTVRGLGFAEGTLSLEILKEGAEEPEIVQATSRQDGSRQAGKPQQAASSGPIEGQYTLQSSARIRALANGRAVGQWTFAVTPDALPTIVMLKVPKRTLRGSMKIEYKAEDDYGVASAEMKVRRPAADASASKNDWAKLPPLSGPRLPLEKPPALALKIPRSGAKSVTASTLLQLGSHPWAGQRVEMWLEVTDVGGKVGRSDARTVVLPERRFTKPLARALIEQRRSLWDDSRNAPRVAQALDALAISPEGFIDDQSVFLGMRAVRHRLTQDMTRARLNESVDQLWHIALRVEEGDLSNAERALKDAQKKLSDALQKGAEDEEIQNLIAELKQRLNEYLEEMRKKAQQEQPQNGDDPNGPQPELGQNDLEEMMKDLEKNAREGSREEAERILSELQEMMDRLQAGQSKEQQAEQKRAREMMKKLNQLGDLAGKQQQLMDETFEKQRAQEQGGERQAGGSQQDNSGQNSQNGRQGEQGQQGQQGTQQQGGQPRQPGGAQQGRGQQGKDGQGVGQKQPSQQDLQNRQAQLRQELDRLQKDLNEMGAGNPDKLARADEAMEEAEQSLQNGEYQDAAEKQGEALEQMRQNAQQMADQMRQNAEQRMGRGGDRPRDPMGRPQRAQGPDEGQSVKVPDAITAQRAREILDELRRRSGESLRPQSELDYIERLLRRF